MQKAKTKTTTKADRETVSALDLILFLEAKDLNAPAPQDFEWQPLPHADTAWRYCSQISRLAFAASRKSDEELVAIHGQLDHEAIDGLMTGFLDTAAAMKAMATLCARAHTRIIASTIRASKAGARFKPAKSSN
jgi:hypothetical protein